MTMPLFGENSMPPAGPDPPAKKVRKPREPKVAKPRQRTRAELEAIAFELSLPDFKYWDSGRAAYTFKGAHREQMTNVLPVSAMVDGAEGMPTILFVSDYPSEEADMHRTTFFGDFKEPLLNAMRRVPIRQCACTYVFPAHIPEEHRTKTGLPGGFARIGRRWLKFVIARYAPKFIVPLGAPALAAVVETLGGDPKTRISSNAGRSIQMGDHTVVPCYSPKMVHAAPEEWLTFQSAITAMERVVCGDRILDDVDVLPLYTPEDQAAALEEISRSTSQFISLDLEWGGGQVIRTAQLATDDRKGYVFVVRDDKMRPNPRQDPDDLIRKIAQAVESHPGMLVGHNLRGDLRVIRQAIGVDLMPRYVRSGLDTMEGYHVLPGRETVSKGLKEVCPRELGVLPWDAELNKFIARPYDTDALGYGGVPDDILIPYAAKDVVYGWRLAKYVLDGLSSPGLEKIRKLYFEILHPRNAPLDEMESLGLLCDMPAIQALSQPYFDVMNELNEKLKTMLRWPEFNAASVDHVREALFGWEKIDPKDKHRRIRKSPEGARLQGLIPVKDSNDKLWDPDDKHTVGPSTDAESLDILLGDNQDNVFLETFANYRAVYQVYKTFLRPTTFEVDEHGDLDIETSGGLTAKITPKGRIHTNYRVTLKTGRFATSPNL